MKITRRLGRIFGWSFIAASLSLSTTAFSQEDDAVEEDSGPVEEITVTGSKIKRDAFSSISPVQVLGGEESLRIGTVDPTQMIAESPFVTGTQLDGSTNSSSSSGATEGVPATGPGAATVSLRGLGAERTLLLVNGRRLSPSGVRGAPVAPDLNLIPAAMIDRKRKNQPQLFLVARAGTNVVATVLGGYDGVRGWMHHLATRPEHRNAGVAAGLITELESRLKKLGCVKLNLQVREGNEAVVAFYEKLGYETEPRVSMGKKL